jgi:phenylacetate-coenzyme A ligase PaaK-like adenylate-forming protein
VRRHWILGREETGDLSAARVRDLVREARGLREAMRRVPVSEVLDLLDRVSRRWRDPGDAVTREGLEILVREMGCSTEMARLELEALATVCSRDYLEAKIVAEFGSLDNLGSWSGSAGTGLRRPHPRGVVLHVAAGNSATGGLLSCLEGLVTRNVNLLKAASGAPSLALGFARLLADEDAGGVLSRALSVLTWPGASSDLHRTFQELADAIVVWGGEDTARAYRDGLGASTHLVVYGPKASFAAITREHLDRHETVRDLARAIAVFDQAACSSPQVCYLEDDSPDAAPTRAFCARLLEALDDVHHRELPQGSLSMAERAELTKERELARFDAAQGQAGLWIPADRAPHATVWFSDDPTFEPSPLLRTIRVKRVPDLAGLGPHLAPYEGSLQTAGLAAPASRVLELADAFVAAGVHRVTTIPGMSGGPPGEPHDGHLGLQELIRWASVEMPAAGERFDAREWLTSGALDELAWVRARDLVHGRARGSAFHRARLDGLSLDSHDDWSRIPPMDRDQVAFHTPPQGTELFTREPVGGHYLRSGGTSASPKLSVFEPADYEADMRVAARGAHAAGLRASDRVGNLFFSGGLYGSFLSVNRVLEIMGCHSFPFTSTVVPADLIAFLRAYRIDTLMGLPSWLLKVFEAIRHDPDGIRIRKLFYTGEPLYAEEAAFLRETHGLEVIASIGYGTVDAGPIGFQCAHGAGGEHHVHADHQLVEIVEPGTGRPVEPGAIGEVLVTNLDRRLMPLIRYRIGDLARWIPEPCACGRAMPRLELMGRSDDQAWIGDVLLRYAEVRAAVGRVPGLNSMAQVVLEREEAGEVLTIRVERVASGAPGGSELALRAALLTGVEALRDLVGQGRVARFAIEVLEVGQLPRLERTGKIRRVIDLRQGAGR